jgi:hypothetical protein
MFTFFTKAVEIHKVGLASHSITMFTFFTKAVERIACLFLSPTRKDGRMARTYRLPFPRFCHERRSNGQNVSLAFSSVRLWKTVEWPERIACLFLGPTMKDGRMARTYRLPFPQSYHERRSNGQNVSLAFSSVLPWKTGEWPERIACLFVSHTMKDGRMARTYRLPFPRSCYERRARWSTRHFNRLVSNYVSVYFKVSYYSQWYLWTSE